MNKVLLLNGSHKTGKSYTMQIAEQFVSGLIEFDAETIVESVHLKDQNINACTGCFACWTTTPGECVFQDDMTELFQKYVDADIVIWATPLYHYGISSSMKKFMERTQPALLPFIDHEGGGTYGHPFRNPEKMANKKHVLISTCGFPSVKNNYEGVEEQFNNLLEGINGKRLSVWRVNCWVFTNWTTLPLHIWIWLGWLAKNMVKI